jgi:hypothetical protein
MNLICGIMAKVARKRKTIWARVGSRWPEIGSRTRDLRRLRRLLKDNAYILNLDGWRFKIELHSLNG